jgi:hypothetical protein
VHYQNMKYEIWSAVKRSRDENTEARGKSLRVTCELTDEGKSILVHGAPIHGLCVWDVEPDPPIDWEKEGFFDK